ncbi:endonuclease V [Candidatus Bathyarchaeota archaeon]|nr:endonuclease V [Candidatus Bathyarchaeota archaeon]
MSSKASWGRRGTSEKIEETDPTIRDEPEEDIHTLNVPDGFSVQTARRAQTLLANEIRVPVQSRLDEIRLVAGIDVAYWEDLGFSVAAIMRLPDLAVEEIQRAVSTIRFPYIPTLLAYRECKPIIRVLTKLRRKADAYIFNGHGLTHPLRLGLASHLGVVLEIRSIGVARGLLNGATLESRGGTKTVMMNGEIVGAEIESPSSKPIYVSTGNRISLQDAVEVVRRCIRSSRLPEPLQRAHSIATQDRAARRMEAV